MLALEMYVLVEAYDRPANKRYVMLLLASIFALGTAFMWVFLVPISIGILGLCVLQTVIANKKLPSLPIIFGFVIIGIFLAFQPLLIWMFPVSFDGGVSMIQQRGFINPTSIEALAAVAALAAIAVLMNRKNQPLKMLFVGLSLALGFSAVLGAYQMHTLGELRYFYYKSTYTAIVIGASLLGAVAYYFSYKIVGATTKFRTAILAILVVAGALVVWQIKDPIALTYIDGGIGGMNQQTAQAVLKQAARGPVVASNTTLLGNCNRGDDIRANLFVTALASTMIYGGASFDQGKHDQARIFEAIVTHLRRSQVPISIISSDQMITAALKAYLGNQAQNPKIEIIDLDQTPETEPISQCPDRIRDIQKYPVQ
jgi:hypothetical protein